MPGLEPHTDTVVTRQKGGLGILYEFESMGRETGDLKRGIHCGRAASEDGSNDGCMERVGAG